MSKKNINREIDETFTAIVRTHQKITIPYELSIKHRVKPGDIITMKMVKLFREGENDETKTIGNENRNTARTE